MQRFDFSHSEYQHFIEVCPFSDEELQILELRRRGKSTVQISIQLCMSERTVARRIKSIVNKIAREL